MAGRRRYSVEFKIAAVELINVKGYTLAEAAESLHVDASTLRLWLKKYGAQIQASPEGHDGAARAEPAAARAGPAFAHGARHLEKAAAFFAGQQP